MSETKTIEMAFLYNAYSGNATLIPSNKNDDIWNFGAENIIVELLHNNEVVSTSPRLYLRVLPNSDEIYSNPADGVFEDENVFYIQTYGSGISPYTSRTQVTIKGSYYNDFILNKISENGGSPILADGYLLRFSECAPTPDVKPAMKLPVNDDAKLLYLLECKVNDATPDELVAAYPNAKESLAKIAFGREAMADVPFHQYPDVTESLSKILELDITVTRS